MKDIQLFNIVRLKNGLVVGIRFIDETTGEMIVTTSPISSIHSEVNIKDIVEIINSSTTFDEEFEWWRENLDYWRNQPLHI